MNIEDYDEESIVLTEEFMDEIEALDEIVWTYEQEPRFDDWSLGIYHLAKSVHSGMIPLTEWTMRN